MELNSTEQVRYFQMVICVLRKYKRGLSYRVVGWLVKRECLKGREEPAMGSFEGELSRQRGQRCKGL